MSTLAQQSNRSRLLVGLGAIAALAVLGVGAASAATRIHWTHDSPRVSASTPTTTTKVADKLRDLGGSHFAGLTIDPGRRVIQSYWTGGVPVAVAEYARTHPGGVAIELVENAPYSRDQLTAAARRIADNSVSQTSHIATIEALSDGSGLEINVSEDVPDDATRTQIAQIAQLPVSAISYAAHSGIADKPAALK